jgi:hypothetical protein
MLRCLREGMTQVARWGVACAVLGWGMCPATRADVISDQAAAILVFPKLVVDTASPPATDRGRVDTLIRISNTSDTPISMWCFYVDVTPQCSNLSGSCLEPITCTGICQQYWQETDFRVNLTARQPVAWLASQGATLCAEGGSSDVPCLPLSQTGQIGFMGQTNDGSRIHPVPEDPFVGELKCVAVDADFLPIERNDLAGEVEIVRSNPDGVDVDAYNAIGIQATAGVRNNGDNTLVIGGPNAEYDGCPSILILDHFFDGADDPVSGQEVTTGLTLVPCTEDFLTQNPITTSVQFLVFNEFEQRFSTGRLVQCIQDLKISNIDVRGNPDRSIFSAAVAGTLTGQTRIQGVPDDDTAHGHTLLGVAEEFRAGGGTAAFNLHFQGTRPQADFIYLPPD